MDTSILRAHGLEELELTAQLLQTDTKFLSGRERSSPYLFLLMLCNLALAMDVQACPKSPHTLMKIQTLRSEAVLTSLHKALERRNLVRLSLPETVRLIGSIGFVFEQTLLFVPGKFGAAKPDGDSRYEGTLDDLLRYLFCQLYSHCTRTFSKKSEILTNLERTAEGPTFRIAFWYDLPKGVGRVHDAKRGE